MEKFTKDMNIIAALDDEPNDVGGLTAYELKAKFDEGGLALQKYINEELLPNLDVKDGGVIDITDQVALTAEETPFEVTWSAYRYFPALGVVFFRVFLKYRLESAVEKGQVYLLEHGGYNPTAEEDQIPAACSTGDFAAEYCADCLKLTVNAALDAMEADKSIRVAGWYFCQGDNVE